MNRLSLRVRVVMNVRMGMLADVLQFHGEHALEVVAFKFDEVRLELVVEDDDLTLLRHRGHPFSTTPTICFTSSSGNVRMTVMAV